MGLTIIWIVVGLALLALELFTKALVCLFFGVGAFAAAVVALGRMGLAVQGVVFVAVAVGTLLLLRPPLKNFFSGWGHSAPDVPHPLLHQQGVVSRAILPGMVGEVSVGGSFWRAESAGGVADALDEGTAVRVLGCAPHNELILRVAPVVAARPS